MVTKANLKLNAPHPEVTESQEQMSNNRKMQRLSRRSTTLLSHQAKKFTREPFITSGYRNSDNITVRQCLATLFTIHNETFNIWSHLIAAVGFLVYFTCIVIEDNIIGNPSIYPLICSAIGTCLLYFSSAFAHLFCCMSWKARNACFYLDHAAISISTFATSQAAIFYCRPMRYQTFALVDIPSVFLCCSVFLACMNVILGCLSRHRYRQYRFFIRTSLYVVRFIFDASPFTARCFIYESCSSRLVYIYKRGLFCYALAAVMNASRLPERLFPGYFDLFGYSHHFLHILVVVGSYDSFSVLHADMTERDDVLSASPYPPTFLTTFGLLILLTVVNSVVVVWFVRNWLTAEEEELFTGSKYLVVYKKESSNDYLNNQRDKKIQ